MVLLKKICITLLTLVLLAAGLVFGTAWYLYGRFPEKFLPYTRINGVYVSGLTADEAEAKLSGFVRDRKFAFKYDNNIYTVPMDSLDFDYSVSSVLESRTFIDPVRSLFRIRKDYQITMNPAASDEFLDKISSLPLCDNRGKVPTEDAYVDLSDFEFRTVKEKIGTEVDPVRVRDIALSDISRGVFSATLTDDDIVVLPELVADSDEFRKRLKYCRDNLDFRLKYKINGESVLITPKEVDRMVSYEKDKPVLKEKKIKKFATEIASFYNEYNEYYAFTTHGGSEIRVKGVNYGKVIDKEGFIDDLSKALKKQKSRTIEINWAQTTYSGGSEIGDSYIEISIAKQHVWCYKNGKIIESCDCVTGAPGHDTARGLFIIRYVTGPTTLKGSNGDGTKYESPVNCFMPFYGEQGLHGSGGWRKKWGGNIYKTDGSHGCVNCPDAAAKKIADNVGYGYPVVIY